MIQIVPSVIYSKYRQTSPQIVITFTFHRLSNCRMGSVEVMEAFCCDLTKNTSLIELRLVNNSHSIIVKWFHSQPNQCWHQVGQPGCSIKVFINNGKYSSVEVRVRETPCSSLHR